LFARLGVVHCPNCGVPGEVAAAASLAERIAEHFSGEVLLLAPLVRKRKGFHREVIEAAAKRGVRQVRIDGVLHDASKAPRPDPRLFTWTQKFGACPTCEGFGALWEEEDAEPEPCPDCAGARLRPEALAVRIEGRHIGEAAALPVRGALEWLRGLSIPPEVKERIYPELENRLAMLDQLGLGYLTLDRGTDTLSTGEAQRIRVVAQLASNLRGVCYVLDEPTVGLHPRDSEALLRALVRLRDRGNTVVVVEHDEPVIRAADHVVDLGPGAGPSGGRVVAEGPPRAIASAQESMTGLWLRGRG